jgi:hypothetical protein
MALLLLTPAGCDGGGGITVDLNDQTPPAVGLTADAGGGVSASAGAAGSTTPLTIARRTVILSLAASGKDSESGVQDLQIWGAVTYVTCQGGTCATHQPLVGAPLFETSEPKKGAGEKTSESTLLFENLDLGLTIPAAADSATVDLSVEGFNHAGLHSRSGVISVQWHS